MTVYDVDNNKIVEVKEDDNKKSKSYKKNNKTNTQTKIL